MSVSSDADAEALVGRLRIEGYRVLAAIEQTQTGRLATVRMTDSKDERSAVTDLLFASCGIEPEIVAAAETLEVLPGLRLPVATVGHLIVMKLLARDDRQRPADADDLAALANAATAEDWATAATGVRLVTARAFHRDRNLAGSLEALRDTVLRKSG